MDAPGPTSADWGDHHHRSSPGDARLASGSISIDVEDWYHILDSPAAPPLAQWHCLPSRIEANLNRLLELLDRHSVKATLFWLGWLAERNPALVRRSAAAGHEIACHGFGHVLAYRVGRRAFAEDARRGKAVLEEITGQSVAGFRAAGFSTTDDTPWTFAQIRAAGYVYDSSVFPARRGHGGMAGAGVRPYVVHTEAGDLLELPQSVVTILNRRVSLFGGGYLRLAPLPLIRWGIDRLRRAGQPLIVYVHPREIDPHHPRLPLGPLRRFKSYVNLASTMPKLDWLLANYRFVTLRDLAEQSWPGDAREAAA
jgi:polysaccharide deacetylase family protein (PEP-CTERM system associated)